MTGEMTSEQVTSFIRPFSLFVTDDANRLKCEEAPDELPTTMKEKITKIACNISKDTNFMHSGIMSVRSLSQVIPALL